MLANYGYEDASGTYYITVNTDMCAECPSHACVGSCPAGIFRIILDDYDDEVVEIKEEARNNLRTLCSNCKAGGKTAWPCTGACEAGAIEHTW